MLFCLLALGSAHAAMGLIPFETLVQRAEFIVKGTVISVRSEAGPPSYSAQGTGRPEYAGIGLAELAVVKTIKGDHLSPSIVIQFPMGEDSPNYRPHEQVYVFLERIPDSERYTTIGLIQGAYRIHGDLVEPGKMSEREFLQRIDQLMALP
jgi:hypothetical protein